MILRSLLLLVAALLLISSSGRCGEMATATFQEKLRNLLCQSNLRTIYQAIQSYAAAHKGRLPDANDQSVRPWLWWDQDLHAYVADLRVFYCPAATPQYFPLLERAQPTTLHLKSGNEITVIPLDVQSDGLVVAMGENYDQAQSIALFDLPPSEAARWRLLAQGDRSPLLPVTWERRDIGYGMNYRFGSPYAKISGYNFAKMRQPGTIILVGDSNHLLLRPTETMWKKDAAPRHSGCSNFLFADGHIEALEPHPDDYSRPDAPGVLNLSHWIPKFAP